MKELTRREQPEELKAVWEEWGQDYAEKKAANKGYRFHWRTVNGKTMNHVLLPVLKGMSDNHCHYCDGYPPVKGDDTIDHFKPKGDERFYTIAYQWENLYLACNHCQSSKLEQFEESLLRPDEVHYSFQRYFLYNYTTHEIGINPEASDEDKERAETTRRIFDFNHLGLVARRRISYERFLSSKEDYVLNDYAFRFILQDEKT